MPMCLIGIGILNTMVLKSHTGKNTMTGWAGEIIGSESTTVMFILSIFISNDPKYCMLVLSPIYLLINIAMLISVNRDLEDDEKKMLLIINVFSRFFLIIMAVHVSQFLVVIQEAELFLQNNNIK